MFDANITNSLTANFSNDGTFDFASKELQPAATNFQNILARGDTGGEITPGRHSAKMSLAPDVAPRGVADKPLLSQSLLPGNNILKPIPTSPAIEAATPAFPPIEPETRPALTQGDVDQLYRKIHRDLYLQSQHAKGTEKPMAIMVGEDHGHLDPLTLDEDGNLNPARAHMAPVYEQAKEKAKQEGRESMLIQLLVFAAAKNLDPSVETVIFEGTQEELNTIGNYTVEQDRFHFSSLIHGARDLGMTRQASGGHHAWRYDRREEAMLATARKQDDAFVFSLGITHLDALSLDMNIRDEFWVVPINAANISEQDRHEDDIDIEEHTWFTNGFADTELSKVPPQYKLPIGRYGDEKVPQVLQYTLPGHIDGLDKVQLREMAEKAVETSGHRSNFKIDQPFNWRICPFSCDFDEFDLSPVP